MIEKPKRLWMFDIHDYYKCIWACQAKYKVENGKHVFEVKPEEIYTFGEQDHNFGELMHWVTQHALRELRELIDEENLLPSEERNVIVTGPGIYLVANPFHSNEYLFIIAYSL